MSPYDPYPEGNKPRYVPQPVGIKEQAESGYLRQNVEIALVMRQMFIDHFHSTTGPGSHVCLVPTWKIAVAAGLDPRKKSQVEKAAVCAGLRILYSKVEVDLNGKKRKASRRCVQILPTPIGEYLKEVKRYQKEKKKRRKEPEVPQR